MAEAGLNFPLIPVESADRPGSGVRVRRATAQLQPGLDADIAVI
jgi:hypothetical protein